MPGVLDCPSVGISAYSQLSKPSTPAIYSSAEQSRPIVGSIAVVIVSNSKLLCEGLSAMLASNTNIVVVDELTAGNLPHPGEPVPKASVVLLDGSIGRDAALRWTHFWCAQSPPVQVIVLELADEVHTIVACIEAGACGYTLRGATMSEVVASIRRAQLGQALCSPEVTARLFARVAATSQAKPEQRAVPLTGRELEVLGYIAVGYSNRSIAEALVIEVRTVKHHVHNILSKLKLSSRADAARYAVEKGWLPRLS